MFDRLPSLPELSSIANVPSPCKIFAGVALIGTLSTACLYRNEITSAARSELEKRNIISPTVNDEKKEDDDDDSSKEKE